jgi:putative endonuclease
MRRHIATGKLGEDLTAGWLLNQGFQILNRNWKAGPLEIDVIAKKANILHFIEVKTRRSHHFGFPEQRVGSRKIQNMANAAELFLISANSECRIQLDIMAISLVKGHIDYFFIEDIYL